MAQFILIIVHYNRAAGFRCALRLFSFPCLHTPPPTQARLLIYNKRNYVVPTTNPFLKIYSDFFFPLTAAAAAPFLLIYQIPHTVWVLKYRKSGEKKKNGTGRTCAFS